MRCNIYIEKNRFVFLPDGRLPQDLPSPLYGWLHEQLNDPRVLVHAAETWQSCTPLAHSLISVDIDKKVDTHNTIKRNNKDLFTWR